MLENQQSHSNENRREKKKRIQFVPTQHLNQTHRSVPASCHMQSLALSLKKLDTLVQHHPHLLLEVLEFAQELEERSSQGSVNKSLKPYCWHHNNTRH